MAENRVQRASKNLIWSGINTIIGLLLPFLTQTCMIYILGVRYVGLNSLFSSILEVLNLTELGIGSALIYSMYKPIALGDDKKICALLALYRKCYHLIGWIIFIIGLLVMPFIKKFISGDVPEDINVYLLFCIYLLNTVISYFMFAYKSSLLSAHQRVDWISFIHMAVSVVKTLIQCGAIILMKQYYYFVIAIPMATVLQNLFIHWLVSKKYPQYTCRGRIKKEEITELKKKVYGLISQKIGGVVISSVDNVVVSSFLGLEVLGLYSNYIFIYKAQKKILQTIQVALTPVIGNSIAMETKEKNYSVFKSLLLIYLWMVSWLAIFQLCFYQSFIKLWVGGNYLLDDITMMFFTLYFYSITIGDLAYTYTQAAGIWWEGRYITLISSTINLVLNLIIVKHIGLIGVLLSTILSVIFIILPFRGKILFHVYFAYPKAWHEYNMIQLKHFVITLLTAGVTYLICVYCLNEEKLISFIGRILVCVILPNIIFFLSYFKHSEFKGVIQILNKMMNQKKQQ